MNIKYLIFLVVGFIPLSHSRTVPTEEELKQGVAGILAIGKSNLTKAEKIARAKKLIAGGINIDEKQKFTNWTPLHYFGVIKNDLNMADFLIELGANVNTRGFSGATPLHDAAFRANLEMVKFLISKGAQINAQDNEGHTPLMAAIIAGKKDVVQYLLPLSDKDLNIRAAEQLAEKNMQALRKAPQDNQEMITLASLLLVYVKILNVFDPRDFDSFIGAFLLPA